MRGEQYLVKPAQFALVYSKGSSHASHLLVLKSIMNGLPLSRYGFSVSKKVGNAVVRNRMKRWLREIMRETALKGGHDIIFIVRPAASVGDYWKIKKAASDLLFRSKLLENRGQPGESIESEMAHKPLN